MEARSAHFRARSGGARVHAGQSPGRKAGDTRRFCRVNETGVNVVRV